MWGGIRGESRDKYAAPLWCTSASVGIGHWELCRVGMDHWELCRVGMGHGHEGDGVGGGEGE